MSTFARTAIHNHIIANSPHLIHILADPSPEHKAIVEAAKLKMAGMPEAASKLEKVKETEANVRPEAAGVNKPDLIGTIAVLEDDGGNSTSWI